MATLTREQFEETVRQRVADGMEAKSLVQQLTALEQEFDRLVQRENAAIANVAAYKRSGDDRLKDAEAELKAARADRTARAAKLDKEITDLRKQLAELHNRMRSADIEIETTRQVNAVFGVQ